MNKLVRYSPLSVALLVACAGYQSSKRAELPERTAATTTTTTTTTTKVLPKTSGVDLGGMDRSVLPGDDFFAFANGTWLKTTEIPSDRSTWGTGGIVTERTTRRTADLIEELGRGSTPGTANAKKVGDYYASFMDEAAIEKKGLTPLEPPLAEIAGIGDKKALATALGKSVRADVDVLNSTDLDTDNLFGLWVAQDLDDPSKYSPFILQGGLELPDRDYYLTNTPRMVEVREKYKTHIAAMMKLATLPDADRRAARVFELETKIAKAHAGREETEDVKKGNTHWSRTDLDRRAPGIDWAAFLAAAKLERESTFVVWQSKAVTGIAALVRSESLDVWKDLLAFHLVERHAAFLPKAFGDEWFAFHGKVLNGTPQQRERWKRAIEETDDALGEVVGQLYVARHFPASEKARAEKMVANVVDAFSKRLDGLSWMAPKTKEQAKAKLAALKVGVGYPDKWRDYSGLEVVRGDAFGNYVRASSFEYARNLAKLGKPVDRSEWVMNAQLVNAVNLPAMNALNFPAGILQPPDFDPNRPLAMDYGSTGATIGHEICHSFDDTGSLFDAKGKLFNWWTPEDLAHFKTAAAALAAQFDAYKPFADAHVNGKLTSGENIADIAGLAAAYDAYRMSNGGKEGPTVDGLTGDQQFFVSFAQGWRFKAREETARKRLIVDVHAPAEYRGDTVRNLDAWYTAFNVLEGQRLYLAPSARVRVY